MAVSTALLVVALMAVAIWQAPHAHGALTFSYLTKWGSRGSGSGQFNTPYGAGVGPSGNVYVADTENHRIQVFSPSGSYVTGWGSRGSGNGQFGEPVTVAFDSSGNVYVADCDNNRVQKFTSSGGYLAQWGTRGRGNGQFDCTTGIAIDGSDNVYVSDEFTYRIQKFTSSGSFLTSWGSRGTGNGQFGWPFELAVDGSNNVYATDYSNNRVQKFTSNGEFLAKWGGAGSGNGQLRSPIGIAVDRSNNVYVADTSNNRVQVFDSSGTYLTLFGGAGSGDGMMSRPQGLAVDGSGNVFVADSGNSRIEVFGAVQPTATPTATATTTPAPTATGTPVATATPTVDPTSTATPLPPTPTPMPDRGWVTGVVLDAHTNQPVPGAIVEVWDAPSIPKQGPSAVGGFHFPGLSVWDGIDGGNVYRIHVVAPPEGYRMVGSDIQMAAIDPAHETWVSFTVEQVPTWVQVYARVGVTLWSGDDTRATQLGHVPQWGYLRVEWSEGSRMCVYNPLTKNWAYASLEGAGPSGPAPGYHASDNSPVPSRGGPPAEGASATQVNTTSVPPTQLFGAG